MPDFFRLSGVAAHKGTTSGWTVLYIILLLLLAIIAPPLSAEIIAPDFHALIEREAHLWGVDAALVKAVVAVESGFYSEARSPKGAMGLMQLMPGTVRRFGVGDPWDPQQNVTGGVRYLRFLLDRFGGDLPLALAGYNAGENSVVRYGGLPPYQETREYVGRVLGCLREYEAATTDLVRPMDLCASGGSSDRLFRSGFSSRWGRGERAMLGIQGTNTDSGLSFLKTSFEGSGCRRGHRCRFSERDKQQLIAQRLRWHSEARLKRGFLLRSDED
ncbi:soluble lytic murein transglycosylase [Gammaproteobacteria bacterium]